LGRPEVGPEDFIADSSRRHAAVEQRRPDKPHERQRAASEDLDIFRERDVGQVHVALIGAGVALIDLFLPGVGSEVVDLSSEVKHGVTKRMILSSPVGVRDDDSPLRLRSSNMFDDGQHGRNACPRTGQQER
jgi:hypothetical protein